MKQYLVNDLSGRGFTTKVGLEDLPGFAERFSLNEGLEDHEDTLEDWAQFAEIGDTWEAINIEIIRIK